VQLGRQRYAGANAPSCTPVRSPRPGFTLIELLVVTLVIGILAAIALPNYVKLKDKAKEAETKAGLHKIQTDLERYAVDNRGEYPPYLIGGERAVMEESYDAQKHLTRYISPTPQELARDPMLRDGYVDSYPHNPFVSDWAAVQQFQEGVGDPLRNGMDDAREGGTRFGPYGDTMGQCLCDARWLQWWRVDPDTRQTQPLYTWSNVEYEFYDAWAGPASRPYLPGSFMYKSMGELAPESSPVSERRYAQVDGQTAMIPEDDKDEVFYPLELTDYELGAWGGTRTKGMDILGEEPLVLFSYTPRHSSSRNTGQFFYNPVTHRYEQTTAPAQKSFTLLAIPPWTRSVNRAHVGPLWGSPYGPAGDDGKQLSNSNPNGLRDGLILVLSGGDMN
jgi:prepilin-type N-terminal cleavage/methylation domain-containing protein